MGRPHQPCKRAIWQLPMVLEIPQAILLVHHFFTVSSSQKSLYLPLQSVQTSTKRGVTLEKLPVNWGGGHRAASDFQRKCTSRGKKDVVLSHLASEDCVCSALSSFSACFKKHYSNIYEEQPLHRLLSHCSFNHPFQKAAFHRDQPENLPRRPVLTTHAPL